jgi:hypothetical protein
MNTEELANLILEHKNVLNNPGTRPTVSTIQQKAGDLVNFIINRTPTSQEVGLIAILTPDQNLVEEYFKGWKVEDFERLALEVENTGN